MLRLLITTENMSRQLNHFEIDEIEVFINVFPSPMTLQACHTHYLEITVSKPYIVGSRPQAS